MAVQSTMNAVILALRSAVANDKKHKAALNKIRDACKAVEADELSRSEMVKRSAHLADVLSESVMSLHKTRPQPTLAFCVAAMRWLFKTKLEPTLEHDDEEDAKEWEDVIFRGLMQPILSIVDSEDQDLDAVGNVLYKEICGIMRSPWSQDFGGRFARSLALVLVCTCSSSSNKAMLLNPSIFGTDTLSKLIIDAKDYHYLDTLLELSFNMFSSQGGKMTRKTYADSIFSSGYALERLPDEISNELTSIHSVTNGGNSEKHVLDIMRTMSRAGIERQVFMTKDLSYCGTRFTQTPPSNVIILDHKNLCMVFCDKNGENDVLTVETTSIKSVELVPQDTSRIIVELAVAEPPLISSSREELAIPDNHIPGSPLKIRLSVASSDILGLEAALAARDLAGVIKDDNALTRHSSLASTKISNAVLSVPLRKNRNPSNEQAEEMIRKYVNLPSSREGSSPSPPPAERDKPTTRAGQPRRPPSGAPVTPTIATRSVASPQAEKLRSEPPFAPRPVDKPASRLPAPAPTDTTPVKPAGPATTRTKRTAAAKSQKAIKLAALADLDSSEPTSTDPGTPAEHTGKQTTVETPAEDIPALPTPPRTRARAQPTKAVAKTLVPATPTANTTPQVSSPPDVSSPSPKPVKKRKLVEDDPFELPPLKKERPTKQKKTEAMGIPSNSQHIRPRNTAATRAKAKYGTISKRMRASSPVESIHSADTEEEDPPGKKREDARVKNTTTTKMQPRSKKNDKSDVPKRQTRAGAASTKAKSASTIETTDAVQSKVSKLGDVPTTETEATGTPELPKKRGRPPKNKPTQQPVKLPVPPTEAADPIEQASSRPEPRDNNATNEAKSTRIEAEPAPAAIAPETIVTIQEEAPEDDDLLERLSPAAEKVLSPPIVDNRPTISSRRSPSPVKTPEIEMEEPEVDVDTIELPVQSLETHSAEGVFHQTRDMTPEPMESTNDNPATKPPSVRLEEVPESTNTSIEVSTEHPDVSQNSAPKSKNRPSVTQTSTKLQITKDMTDGTHDRTPMDIDIKKSAPLSTRLTRNTANRATCQEGPKPAPVVADVEALASTPQGRKLAVTVETLDQQRPARITERIQTENTQAMVTHIPVRQVETPPAKVRRTKFPPVFVSVDLADSDVEMEPPQAFASHQANMEPIRRPSVLTSRITPTTRPGVNPQSHPTPAPAKVKHAAVTRVLFDTHTQLSPKSALASPQRRTLANGTRPSVSFLEPPVHISRRGSSGSSTEGVRNQQTYCIDGEKLREGHSAHTGDVIIRITDTMAKIQETIAVNLGEKIQIINAEARSARAELTKSLIEELDKMKAESDFHHKVLHKFESAFASQAQAMLEGLGRVVERNDRMNTGIDSILTANARAGQRMAKNTVDFQVPDLFGAFLTS
ncbi:unnamed protein product [Rhizoctonia solani]|uniref:Uncharacterized protein n=1 Tax=Rhizoctonia solani TaxID=456999 RepID=A0A8H2XM82_9AGAM|nr:unnamed protein product [Rhizoctonia solani]